MKKTTKGRKVIARKNLPTALPFWQTVTLVLVLDRFGAPDWLWGVAGTLTVIVWAAWIYAMGWREERVDVLATKDAPAAAAPFVTTESTVESRGIEWDVAIGGHA